MAWRMHAHAYLSRNMSKMHIEYSTQSSLPFPSNEVLYPKLANKSLCFGLQNEAL